MLLRACRMLLRVNVYMCMSQHRDAPGPDTSCCPHPPLMHLPPRQGKERPWMARVGFTVTCLHRAHRSSYPFYPTPRLHVCVYVCVCMRVGERERERVCVCACRCALPNFFLLSCLPVRGVWCEPTWARCCRPALPNLFLFLSLFLLCPPMCVVVKNLCRRTYLACRNQPLA